MDGIITIVVIVVAAAIILFGMLAMVARFYRQVDQGKALIVNTLRADPVVTFTGGVVLPVVNRAELMDLSVKTIQIDRRGKEGLICNDNIRADINVTFFVRVNKTAGDVLKVAQSIGCARASDPRALVELFNAKFSEALKTVGKHFDFDQLYTKRDEFKDAIIKVIGRDLNGFILDDAAIDYLEQTPLEALDRDNIMDSEGIRKITALTVEKNVQTNELRQRERMEVGSQNLSADEAVFRFEQRKAEAEAKKDKEISIAQSREQNEALRVASEEHKKTLLVQHRNDEETLIAAETKMRGVTVAQKNREREIAVETERVERAKQLEVVSREREVSLVVLAKDRELQKKEIADVVRSRIAVDKTVAAEEELIKDLRTTAQATREKDVIRIQAEAAAQENSVKLIAAAEAQETAAKHSARQKVIAADAEMETAEKFSRAKMRLAEGVQAEEAAKGLAMARVKEADAIAHEKLGLVEAKVSLEKMTAAAQGEERQGLARVQVRQAESVAIEKQGLADASVIRERMIAEAVGIREKADAMRVLDDSSRAHEEFRMTLEKDRTVQLESIKARKELAHANADVLGKSLANAKFNIVGGDGAFFDRYVKAISVGQSIEGALEQSSTLRAVARDLTKDGSIEPELAKLIEQFAGGDKDARGKLLGLVRGNVPSKA
jgi:uncharacterized membrane protein YqiK